MTDLNASTTDMNSTAQYGSIVSRTHSKINNSGHGKLYLDIRLHKPKKLLKYDQHILVRKSNTAFKVFAGYMRKFLYVFTDFQVLEMLHAARPWIFA